MSRLPSPNLIHQKRDTLNSIGENCDLISDQKAVSTVANDYGVRFNRNTNKKALTNLGGLKGLLSQTNTQQVRLCCEQF